MKKFIQEFKAFALRGNVMDMAVGVMIGSAFSGIVTSLTENFINPIISLLTGAQRYTLQDAAGFASNFVSALFNFIILALILFCMMKAVNKLLALGRKPAAPTTKKCPYCLSDIPIAATRCPHCTSRLEEADAAAPRRKVSAPAAKNAKKRQDPCKVLPFFFLCSGISIQACACRSFIRCQLM